MVLQQNIQSHACKKDLHGTTREPEQWIDHILHVGQVLCQQIKEPQKAIIILRNEIAWVTCGRIQLLYTPSPSGYSHTSSIPIVFGAFRYGMLSIRRPFNVAEQNDTTHERILAHICGWILYTLEQLTFIQSQSKNVSGTKRHDLTKRECEILYLMRDGYKRDQIAEKLCITPATVRKHKQHIYERLNVHSQQEALIVAHQMGIFSIAQSVNDE